MPYRRLTLQVPGKLMIAGEYAVLEPHQPSVVVAVDRYLRATIALAEDHQLSLPDLGLPKVKFQDLHGDIRFAFKDPRLRFVGEAIKVSLAYLREQFLLTFPFHLTIESELDDDTGKKYGLGSSAAAVVATVAAVLLFLGDEDEGPPPPELVFKLAAIAHLRAQGSGSGADVAAATYGGWLRYSSFQPEWLAERLERSWPVGRLLHEPWPFFSATPMGPLPRELCLCVGWTGEPASTTSMLERVRALRDREPQAYGNFLQESHASVDLLVDGLRHGDRAATLKAIERNRKALAHLGELAGVPIETQSLLELHRWAELCGGAGKPSGAGGGDCGVALIYGEDRAESLYAAWEKAGLTPLRLGVAEHGIMVTRVEE
jgi:phosphomevalonate kinase